MIKDFDNFLNEAFRARGSVKPVAAPPSKAALYKVDDLLKCIPYREYRSNMSRTKFYNSECGMIVKVTKVEAKSGKWFYHTRLQYGGYKSVQSSVRSMSSVDSYEAYIGSFEKDFTIEGVKEFEEIIGKANHKKGDEVTIEIDSPVITIDTDGRKFKTKKALTAKIRSFAVEQSLRLKEPCYLIGDNVFSEKSIEEKTNISEDAIPFLAEEIAKKLNVKVRAEKYGEDMRYKFEVASINTSKLFSKDNEKMYFESEEKKKKFTTEFEALAKKYINKELQEAFGKNIDIDESHFPPTSTYSYPEIKDKDIPDTFRSLRMNIKEFLEKYIVKISTKLFGI